MTKRTLSLPVALLAFLASGALLLIAPGCGSKCEAGGSEVCTDVTCVPDDPMICPNLSPIAYCAVVPGGGPINDPAGSYMYSLMITNRGEADLIIDNVDVMNDARTSVQNCGLSDSVVPTNMSTFLQFFYNPPADGDDQLWFEITSNAANFDPLVIPMCGRAAAMFDPSDCPTCDCPSDDATCPIESPTSSDVCPIL